MFDNQIFTRNGVYYFRQWIPVDLRSAYGGRVELVKSLKTKDKKQARALASGFHQKFNVTFSLLRTGLLSTELVDLLVLGNRPTANQVAPDPPPPPPIASTLNLTTLIALFTRENSQKWTEKSQQEFAGQFKLLTMVLGDKPVNIIDRACCLDCREMLLKIPPSYTKKKELRTLPLPSLVSLGLQGLSTKTVNKHMVLLSSVFKWGVVRGHMNRNPAEGLSLENHKKADEERKAYDGDDLKRIVNNLPTDDPAKYWIPLLAMCSGMRLEEICQMTAKDFKCIDGIPCCHVNDAGDKRVKTKASVRIVPVHPDLIKLGLLEYVASKPDGNLWGLTRGKWGYGKKITNWWTRFFNRKYVTDDPHKCFHSFRHTFANALKQQGEQESLIAELMGHANGSITTGRYGKRYQPQILLDAIRKLEFGITIPEHTSDSLPK